MSYNKSIVRLNKAHFKKIIGDSTIAEYFQIVPAIGSLQFNISFPGNDDDNDGTYIFTVMYKTKYVAQYDFVNLPVELNDVINSYLADYIILECMIDLRHDFPFSKSVWNLMKVEHSYSKRIPICLFDYYGYIVHLHNEMYNEKKNWSPIIGIKSDILKFISRVNHFEVFNEY
jgi:hypothetical protein